MVYDLNETAFAIFCKIRRHDRMTVWYYVLRLARARQHCHWIGDDWKNVALSDECRFQLNQVDGRMRAWRQPRESMVSTCQQRTHRVGGGSVMVRGVCSWRDVGPLIQLQATLTGDTYVRVLSNPLYAFVSAFRQTMKIPAGQYDTPQHVESCSWVAPGTLFRHFLLAT